MVKYDGDELKIPQAPVPYDASNEEVQRWRYLMQEMKAAGTWQWLPGMAAVSPDCMRLVAKRDRHYWCGIAHKDHLWVNCESHLVPDMSDWATRVLVEAMLRQGRERAMYVPAYGDADDDDDDDGSV